MTAALNYALYQAGWCAGVFGAAGGNPAGGAWVLAALIAVHLVLARRRGDEAILIATVAAIGVAVDALQMQLGTLRFPTGLLLSPLPPVWLTLLWAQMATTLRFSLAWLRGYKALLFGALGGPAAFLIGARLGAVELGLPLWRSLVVLGVLWSVAMPLAVRAADIHRSEGDSGRYRWPRG